MAILLGLGTLVFILATAFLQSVTFYYLWGWFVVPLGVLAVGKAQAYGLMLLVTTVLSGKANQKIDDKNIALEIGRILLGPLLTLAIGYLVHRLGVS